MPLGIYRSSAFSIIGDGQVLNDVSATSSSPVITSATGGFESSDVGKSVTLYSGKHQSLSCSFTNGDATVTTASTANLVAGMRVSAVKTVETTGNLTSSSTTISNLGTTTGLVEGMIVSGNGVAGGTTVVSINTGASTMVISVAADGSGTGVSLIFAKHIVPLDATILSITDGTNFELSENATATSSSLTTDFVPGYIQTTISGVSGPTSITLADNAVASVTNGRMIFGTDNTSSLNAALASLYTRGGGVLQFDAGLYIIAGPLQDALVRNSVILVPNENSGQITSIVLQGSGTPAMESNGFLNYPPSLTGTVIFCPTEPSGTDPCMFSGNNAGGLSSITFQCTDMTFRRPQWSLLGEFNFREGGALLINQCVIEPDYVLFSEFLSHAYPSNQTSIIFPNAGNGGFVVCDSSRITGSGTAIKGSTHLTVVDTMFTACRVAVSGDADGNSGSIRVHNSHMVGCGYNFFAPTGGTITIFSVFGVELENQGFGPFINFWDFYDEDGTKLHGYAQVVLLTSNQARTSSNYISVTYVSTTHRETINPYYMLLKNAQYFVFRGSVDGASTGFSFEDFAGNVLGYEFATPDFGGQYVIQSGTGKTLSVRNSGGTGLVVDASTGQMIGSTLKLTALPTSSAGLASGEIWSNSNVLTKVP